MKPSDYSIYTFKRLTALATLQRKLQTRDGVCVFGILEIGTLFRFTCIYLLNLIRNQSAARSVSGTQRYQMVRSVDS